MSDILVIICPSGKQCSHLIPLLYNKGTFKLRLAAHSTKSAKALTSIYPEAEVVSTDLTSLAACQALLHGATSVYHVGPSFHSHEKEIGLNMVDAAVSETRRPGSKFEHFVFSSVLSTQHRSLIQHDLKSYVEERLFLSDLKWTIIKPTNFMDAYPVAMLAAQEEPVLERFWSVNNPNSLIALRDLAEAAAEVLNAREKHYFAEYPLCSTMPTSDVEVANLVGKRIGKDVVTTVAPNGVEVILQWLFGAEGGVENTNYGDIGKNGASQALLAAEGDVRDDLARDMAERIVLYYNRRGLVGSPNVLKWLLGREPTSVEEWIEIQMKEAGIP